MNAAGRFLRAMGWAKCPPQAPILHHVTVQVEPNHLMRLRFFYEKVLGLTKIESPVHSAIWYKEGVHLYHGKGRRIPPLEPSPAHFALVLGSRYEEVCNACIDNGLFVQTGTEYWGSPRCYVRDPDNNRIELIEFAP